MEIAGIQKLTLVDFPGHVAATVFTRGCNFRCGFCHNPELVLPDHYNPVLSEKQIVDFLISRFGKLNGICITGGEPTLQKDCDKFISHMRALGYDVKLDTNGSNPKMLKKIIEDGDVNYIAMDIKNSLKKYLVTTGCHSEVDSESSSLVKNIQESISLIMNSGIDYEFRTTVCHPLHEVKDFKEIGEMIKGAKRYFIQNFQQSKHINEHEKYSPFSDEEIAEAEKIMGEYIKESRLR
jgi:pyruvate formate lyase activating enzyme